MKLYPYTASEEAGCLAIFDSNTPAFFAVQERETFQAFLRRLAAPYAYYVVRDNDGKIVACGGIKLLKEGRGDRAPTSGVAHLRWDMVSAALHGRQIGTFLVSSRLALIREQAEIKTVRLWTSQHTHAFYEKMGFVVLSITPDGIVPGMDEYAMEMRFMETA